MARFYVRNAQSNEIISNLGVSDLKTMAKEGHLSPNDRIRKSGHTTWHLASAVTGLEFLEIDVTSVISLHDTEVTSEDPFQGYSSDDELESSTGPPQYGTLESSYEHISEQVPDKGSAMFTVRWTDKRVDGPFNLDSIESLVADGVIQHDCTFQKEGSQTWNSIVSLGIQSISNEYFVTWEDGRTDGPFNLPKIQSLVIDGFVPNSCTFKHSEGVQVIPYSAMNLLDMQADPSTTPSSSTPSLTETFSDPTHQQVTTATKPKKEKKIKQKKQKKEREPRRAGWLRRFVVKTTASVVIVALVIGLGCWGIWTALSDSQKVKVTKKYEEIKTSMFGDDDTNSTISSSSTTTADPENDTTGGVVSNVESITALPTPSNPTSGPVGVLVGNGNISIPQYGSLWVHKELSLPVVGSYALASDGSGSWWMPMLFLIPPKNELQGTLQLKAYYPAEQFGKQKWFWVNRNRVITNGGGGPSDGIPTMGSQSAKLLGIGDILGIGNQNLQKTNLVRSWRNRSRRLLDVVWDAEEFRDPQRYSATIDEKMMGNIVRISLGGWNEGSSTKYLQFERDAANRVTAVKRYDKQGTELGPFLQFKYGKDNSLLSFNTANYTRDANDMDEWVPEYSSGKLNSIKGIQGDRTVKAIYKYDGVGRISQIFVDISEDKEGKGSRGSKKNEINIDRFEQNYIATFAYEANNEYWSTATLTGETTETKIRGLATSPEVEKDKLGFVRYEQILTR